MDQSTTTLLQTSDQLSCAVSDMKIFSAVFFMENLLFWFCLVPLTPCFGSNSYTANDEAPGLMEFLVSIATRETMTVIVYAHFWDLTPEVLELLTYHSQRLVIYEYHLFEPFLRNYMIDSLEMGSLELHMSLNFLIICGEESIEDMFTYVTHLDKTIGQGSLLRHFSTWLIISPDSLPHLNITLDNVAIIRVAKKRHFPLGQISNVTVLTSINVNKVSYIQSKISVYTLLWVPEGRSWSRVTTCDLSDDLLYTSVFPNSQRGLNGRQLVLTMLEWPPYSKRQVIDGEVSYTGAGSDVMGILGKNLNFSYIIVEPKDMSWGRKLENGSWTGIYKMLIRNEADLCPIPFGFNLQRKKVLDFSLIYTYEYSALYKRLKADTFWLYFLSCFSWQVILCGISSLVWVGILFRCLNKQRRICHNSSQTENLSFLETGINIPLRQAISVLPEVTSARILICTWCLFCLIMTAVYTGNLVAFATLYKQKPPFNTLQELAEEDQYEIGTFEGDYVHDMMMTSDDQTYKALFKKLKNPTKVFNTTLEDMIDLCLQRLLKDKYVFMAKQEFTKKIKSRTCEVVEMKDMLYSVPSGFIYPRHSPIRNVLHAKLMHLKELGVIDELIKERTPKPMICASSEHVPKFHLKNLSTVLIICSSSITLAAVVLLLERRKKK